MISAPVHVMLQATTANDRVLVADSHATYLSAAKSFKRTHETLNPTNGVLSQGSCFSNTVNNQHSVMKRASNHFRQYVATKYLYNYMKWFSRQEFGADKHMEPDFTDDHLVSCNGELE